MMHAEPWYGRRAGAREAWLYEFGSRLAALGQRAVWIHAGAAHPPGMDTGGIEMHRVGARLLYPMLARTVVARLGASLAAKSVVVESAGPGMLWPEGRAGGAHIVPVRFDDAPLPEPFAQGASCVLHATEEGALPVGHVSAPFGAHTLEPRGVHPKRQQRAAVVSHSLGHAMALVRHLARHEPGMRFSLWSPKPPRRLYANVTWEGWPPWHEDGRAAYADASVAYCGAGLEPEALTFAAARVPALVPKTARGAALSHAHPDAIGLSEETTPKALARIMSATRSDDLRYRRLEARLPETLPRHWDATLRPAIEAILNLSEHEEPSRAVLHRLR